MSQHFNTWDGWKPVGKMTDRDLSEELVRVAKMVGHGPVGTTLDSQYRIQCLCNEAAKRVRQRNYHRGDGLQS